LRFGKSSGYGAVLLALAVAISVSGATAGPLEDGMVAYNRGDYVPAIKLFRPLAAKGNNSAQKLLAKIYHKGDTTRNSVRAYMWYDIAASQGDADAEAERELVARNMSAQQIEDARAMAQRCLSSHYARCK
jgi:TPR repeat protein